MPTSRAEIASNTSEVENWVYTLLTKLQASSNNIFEVDGNDEYREVKNLDFTIFYTEGIITIKDDVITVHSDGTYEVNLTLGGHIQSIWVVIPSLAYEKNIEIVDNQITLTITEGL